YHQHGTPFSEGAMQSVLLANGRMLASRTDPNSTTGYASLCVLSDEVAVAGGTDGSLVAIDLTGAGVPRSVRLTVAHAPIACATDAEGSVYAFSPDGEIWSVDAQRMSFAEPRRVPVGGIDDVAVSPDGRWIAAGTDEGTVVIWPATAPPAAAPTVMLR